MGQDYVLVNDELSPAEEASVSVFDLGFMRGVGVFETLRTYAGGLPHALPAHRERMWNAAKVLGIESIKTESEIRADIAKLYELCGYEELRINLMVTPGINNDGLFNATTPTWVVIAKQLKVFPAEYYTDGIKTVTFEGERFMPQLKTTNYLAGRQGYMAGLEKGASEAFYVNADGYVTEGVTSNILVLKGQTMYEVEGGCLEGITKAGIKIVAEQSGLTWEKTMLKRDDIYAADEVYITSSVREIVPVIAVDDHQIGDGAVGPVAKQLKDAYHQFCIDEVQSDAAASV